MTFNKFVVSMVFFASISAHANWNPIQMGDYRSLYRLLTSGEHSASSPLDDLAVYVFEKHLAGQNLNALTAISLAGAIPADKSAEILAEAKAPGKSDKDISNLLLKEGFITLLQNQKNSDPRLSSGSADALRKAGQGAVQLFEKLSGPADLKPTQSNQSWDKYTTYAIAHYLKSHPTNPNIDAVLNKYETMFLDQNLKAPRTHEQQVRQMLRLENLAPMETSDVSKEPTGVPSLFELALRAYQPRPRIYGAQGLQQLLMKVPTAQFQQITEYLDPSAQMNSACLSRDTERSIEFARHQALSHGPRVSIDADGDEEMCQSSPKVESPVVEPLDSPRAVGPSSVGPSSVGSSSVASSSASASSAPPQEDLSEQVARRAALYLESRFMPDFNADEIAAIKKTGKDLAQERIKLRDPKLNQCIAEIQDKGMGVVDRNRLDGIVFNGISATQLICMMWKGSVSKEAKFRFSDNLMSFNKEQGQYRKEALIGWLKRYYFKVRSVKKVTPAPMCTIQ